jgi:hypothetical protein
VLLTLEHGPAAVETGVFHPEGKRDASSVAVDGWISVNPSPASIVVSPYLLCDQLSMITDLA